MVKEHLEAECAGWWHIAEYDKVIAFELTADMVMFRLWLSCEPLGHTGLDDEN